MSEKVKSLAGFISVLSGRFPDDQYLFLEGGVANFGRWRTRVRGAAEVLGQATA